ncbi:MAG: hypothetical protein M1281_08400 [Chloroflexi bacterium]|nr:hypothetical protein [Chloroflexota bacterium]
MVWAYSFSRFFKRSIWLLLLGLAACQPLVGDPLPAPRLIQVQITPALAAWRGKLGNCAAQDASIGLIVDEVPADQMALAKADLLLRIGPGPDTPKTASVVGWEEVVMIVNPQNSLASITGKSWSELLAGRIQDWAAVDPGSKAPTDQTGSVNLWSYLPGDDVRQAVENALGADVELSPRANLAPSPAAMLEAVAKDPNAFGYLPRSWLDNRVREITLLGEGLPDLQQPVLALTASPPQGPLRQLIGCLSKKGL